MKRILLVLALVVSATVLTSPQANAAELLVNGGFESGALSPWACTGGTGSVVSSPVHSGTKALQGVPTDQDNSQCTQTVSVVSGSSYTLSGWFRGAYTYIGVTGGASTWRSDPSNWGQLTVTFTASSSSVEVYVHGWYSQGAYQADDLSLQGAGGGGGTVPGAPSGLSVTGTTSSSISLSWSAGTGTITGYRVYEGTTVVSTGTGTTATISSLGACTSHTYFVRAYNSTGESANSNSVSGTTTGCSGVPGAPSNLQVGTTTSSSIPLSWSAGTGTITGYRVYEGSTQRAQVTGLSTTITGLSACTSHTYVVRAYNASGESPNSNSVTGSTTGCTGGGTKLMGYFVDWGVYQRNYHVKNIETSGSASKLTHINYAFGNVTNGQCAIGDSYADYDKFYDAASSVNGTSDTWDAGALRGSFHQLQELKAMHPGLKVIYSFGGWTWSGGFGQAAANAAAFADSCYNLVHDPRWNGVFDGIDIDWEYPNACGLSCDSSGFAAFKTLMAALRSRFGSSAIITAAITADGTSGGKQDLADYAGAAQYVDWYNVMTYDFFGAWATTGPTAPHSPLSCYSGIPTAGFCTDNAIAHLKSKGIPGSKLLPGIGFYGRGWTGVTQSAPGGSATGAATGTYEAGIEDYKVLKTSCPPTGTVGGTSYSFCGGNWWSYDTPSTIAGKMSWAKGQGLGGAFFWELTGDTTNGELITAMKNGLG